MAKIVILGAGESGTGVALLAKKQGFEPWVSDSGKIKDLFKKDLSEAGIPFEEGRHSLEKMTNARYVVKSPGIPDEAKVVRVLKKEGSTIISEIEFASWFCQAKIIGITGSNGKTTTSKLTYHLLKTGGIQAGLAGNISPSFSRILLSDTFDWIVLELSSFQLDGIRKFRPDIAVLLNITPDHLDRYGYKLENYVDSKFRITKNQRLCDRLIYNKDDENIDRYLSSKEVMTKRIPIGMPAKSGESNLELPDGFGFQLTNRALAGRHNCFNTLCAVQAARFAGVQRDAIENGLATFVNVPHRMELAAEIEGISFINDSKATNVDAVFYALETLEEEAVWIVGGQDKGNDYSSLLSMVKEKIKAIVFLGVDNTKLRDVFGGLEKPVFETKNIVEAVHWAFHQANRGDAVLLSPACASFDLFDNYEQRGDLFKEAVRELQLKNKFL